MAIILFLWYTFQYIKLKKKHYNIKMRKHTLEKFEHSYIQRKKWKRLFSNTQVFYIVLTEHDLNRHPGLNI